MNIRRHFTMAAMLLLLVNGCGQANALNNSAGQAGQALQPLSRGQSQGIIGNEAGGTADHAVRRQPVTTEPSGGSTPRYTGDDIRPSIRNPNANNSTASLP